MKNLFKLTLGVLIFTGPGLVMAEEAFVNNKPLVKTQVNADANVESNTKMTSGKVDVNETDTIEINNPAIRDNEINIRKAREDVDRDIKKLSEDIDALKEAQTKTDDQVIAKAKADVDEDKALIKKDRERLKKFIAEKIKNVRVVIRKLDDRIRDTRDAIIRDGKKVSDDTARLADAQSKNIADDIEKAKANVETDKAVVDTDTTKLNNRIAYKAKCDLELRNDRRHLDEVVKHIANSEEISVSDSTSGEVSASAQ